MKKVFVFAVLLLCSCSAGRFSFTSVYNQQIVQYAEDGMNYYDTLYAKIIAASDKRYINFAPEYLHGEGIINSICLSDSARGNNAILMSNDLRTHALKYELDHKTRGVLSDGELRAYKSQLHAFWYAQLVREQNLSH